MNKEDLNKIGNTNLSIYWWNFGSKTLDFKGSYKEYLEKRNIKMRIIKHPFHKEINGLRFKIPLSSCVSTLDIFDNNIIRNCDEAIKIFLTLMGDKHLFINGSRRNIKLNWR